MVALVWRRLAFATGFADFNAEANGKHIRHLPFASALKAIGEMANAFASGECGVFANSLKRIGKWRMIGKG